GDWWWYDSSGARDDHADGDDGFAEAFFNSGAVVYIGSTEVSPGTENDASGPALLRNWGPDETIGEALAAYKRDKVGDSNWWRFWVTEYNLYGDPKFGALGGGGAMMSAAAEPEAPAPSAHADVALTQADDISPIELSIPDYRVEPVGELDHVTIPEGDLIFEQGRPAVPYCAVTRHLEPGILVQDVRLVERGDLQTTDGLVLPLANCVPDLEGYIATEAVPTFAGWFPTKTYDWNVVPNGDGSSTLRLRVYPFFYNRTTTEARFWRQFTFALETVASPVQVRALWTDKAIYEVGQTVTVGLKVESTGDPADAVVNAVVRRYGTDEKLAGLLLESLDALTGAASFSSDWDSANAAPGICYVDVTIADLAGRILERRTALFRLDAPVDGQ
ncbi:MAG: hypothetical protein JW741_24225, partial [Sedimentisphaerales bacterium]|nr:hypothetical protein [Sedimentisphaerales bacterium]